MMKSHEKCTKDERRYVQTMCGSDVEVNLVMFKCITTSNFVYNIEDGTFLRK